MDLFQRLHHLRQPGAAQLTEQGLGAGWGGQEGASGQGSPHTPRPDPHPTGSPHSLSVKKMCAAL